MAKKDLLISIIVPVYNVELWIQKSLESITNQTYTNLQIILVDDGSTDNSGIICDDFAQKDMRVIAVHKKNGGLVSARKEGIKYVEGAYIISIDSDDWIELNYIEKFVYAICETGASQVWSISYNRDFENKSYFESAEINIKGDINNALIQEYLFDKAVGKLGYNDDIPYYTWTKCVKADLFKKAYMSLHDDINYMEDFSFAVRSIATDNNIFFIDNPGYHYIQRDNSITHIMTNKDVDSLKIMREDTIKYLKNGDYYEYLKNVLEKKYISAMVAKNFGGLQSNGKEYLVPFKNVKWNSKIIVFGMGNVGKWISEYIANSPKYELVGCCDMRKVEKIGKLYNVIDINKINDYDFDYIIISTVKASFIRDIKTQLIDIGIDDKKIKSIDIL